MSIYSANNDFGWDKPSWSHVNVSKREEGWAEILQTPE